MSVLADDGATTLEFLDLWNREYAYKIDDLDYRLSRSAPLFFGRRRWRERRDRLMAQLRDEYEQIYAAIVENQLDRIGKIRGEFLVKEVYVVLRGKAP